MNLGFGFRFKLIVHTDKLTTHRHFSVISLFAGIYESGEPHIRCYTIELPTDEIILVFRTSKTYCRPKLRGVIFWFSTFSSDDQIIFILMAHLKTHSLSRLQYISLDGRMSDTWENIWREAFVA
jgi:hypothetical protein